jgi:hypothetical protein
VELLRLHSALHRLGDGLATPKDDERRDATAVPRHALQAGNPTYWFRGHEVSPKGTDSGSQGPADDGSIGFREERLQSEWIGSETGTTQR